MSQSHPQPNYIAIFWWLLGLTIGEIGVIYLGLPKIAMAIFLIGFALVKAALVAMYFMHLKFEKRTLGIIVITPLALCVLLVFALLPDLKAIGPRSSAAAASRPAPAAEK